MLWHEEPDGPGFWAVTRYDDVATINRDHRIFSSAVGGVMIEDLPDLLVLLQEQMLNMDPPRHTKLRLLVNKGFTPRMIGQLQDAIRSQCTRIVDAVVERGECDFVNDVAAELHSRSSPRCSGSRGGPPSDLRLDQHTGRQPGPGVQADPRGRHGSRDADVLLLS